jgi:hypothetical protein
MEYLKKELNKLLPLALLFGAVGGVLLIILGNVIFSDKWSYLLTYTLVIGLSVYLLNRMRFKKEIMSSVIYGYAVFFVMTLIAWFDMVLNANPNFISPIFEKISFFAALMVSVFLIAASIATLFKRRVLM